MNKITQILEHNYNKIQSSKDVRSLNILFEGDPSSGKSYLCEQFAKSKGIPFVCLDMPNLILETISGIPYREGNKVYNAKPQWLIDLGDNGLLLLDEFNAGDDDTQKLVMSLLSDRRIGEHQLGKKVMIVAAQNNFQQCNNYKMSPAMLSRFEKWQVEFDYDDWRNNYLPLKLSPFECDILDKLIAKGFKFSTGKDFDNEAITTTARSIERWLTASNKDLEWLELSAPSNMSIYCVTVVKELFRQLKDKKGVEQSIFSNTATKIDFTSPYGYKLQYNEGHKPYFYKTEDKL